MAEGWEGRGSDIVVRGEGRWAGGRVGGVAGGVVVEMLYNTIKK